MTLESNALHVRPAETRDLEAVHHIEVKAFSDPWSLAAFGEFLAQPQVQFDVATSQVRGLEGYLIVLHASDEAEVANLAVAESSRRRGVGTALLTRYLAGAVTAGVRTVFLEVRESNGAARRLYEEHGFEQVGRRREYYRQPLEDALLLRREL